MQLFDSLLQLERKLWMAGPELYRQTLADDVLMVFPDPVGVLDRDAVLESIADAPRWQELEMREPRFVRLRQDAVVLTYRFPS